MSASEVKICRCDESQATEVDDKISGMLVNVFGLRLPNEMLSQAARSSAELAQILHQYAQAIENAKRN